MHKVLILSLMGGKKYFEWVPYSFALILIIIIIPVKRTVEFQKGNNNSLCVM